MPSQQCPYLNHLWAQSIFKHFSPQRNTIPLLFHPSPRIPSPLSPETQTPVASARADVPDRDSSYNGNDAADF